MGTADANCAGRLHSQDGDGGAAAIGWRSEGIGSSGRMPHRGCGECDLSDGSLQCRRTDLRRRMGPRVRYEKGSGAGLLRRGRSMAMAGRIGGSGPVAGHRRAARHTLDAGEQGQQNDGDDGQLQTTHPDVMIQRARRERIRHGRAKKVALGVRPQCAEILRVYGLQGSRIR